MKWAWKKADLLIAYRIMWNWKMLLIRYNVHFVKRFFFCWSIREFGVCMPMCANVCWVNVFFVDMRVGRSTWTQCAYKCGCRLLFIYSANVCTSHFTCSTSVCLAKWLRKRSNSYSLRYGSHLFTVRLSNFISKERERVERTIYIYLKKKKQYEL